MRSNQRTNEEMVRAVPEPPFTRSWHPISHDKLLTSMYHSAETLQADIIFSDYTLSEDGLDLFGTWTLDTQYKGNNLNIGFRNSMKKHFAVGFCAGRFIIVCSNMQFSGEFVEFRKHTSGLNMDELDYLTQKGFKSIKTKMKTFADWHESLKEISLPHSEMKKLTYDAMEQGVFPPSKFNKFLDCHNEERMLNGDTLHSFYGGVTRLVRDNSLFNIQQTTRSLNQLTEDYQRYAA